MGEGYCKLHLETLSREILELRMLEEGNRWREVEILNQGDAAPKVVNAKAIIAVVAMVPHGSFQKDLVGRFLVVEKPRMDVAHMGGNDEGITDK